MDRRTLLKIGGLLTLAPSLAHARGYPDRPVRIVVGFPPGGGSDQVARPLSARMPDVLGQPVVIDNRPGANGSIGLSHVAQSPPDGYTIGHVNNVVIAVNPLLYRNLPFDPIKSFEPIATVNVGGLVAFVPAELPVRTLQEFVEYAKPRQGQLNFGSAGIGSVTHLAYELFSRQTNTKLELIHYRGSAPALQDMLGGRIQLMMDGVSVAKGMADAGRIRIIGFLGSDRHPLLSDVPTAIEQGIPKLSVPGWQGFVAPANTPVEALEKLQAAFKHAVDHEEVKKAYGAQAIIGRFQDRETMRRLIREDIERWKPIIAELNLKLE